MQKTMMKLYREVIKEHYAEIQREKELKKDFPAMYREAIREYKNSWIYKQRQKKATTNG